MIGAFRGVYFWRYARLVGFQAFDRPPDGKDANSPEIDVVLSGYDPENSIWAWFCAQVERLEGGGRIEAVSDSDTAQR